MDTEIESAPPTWLVDSLDRSESEIGAGESLPMEPVLDRLRASIDRMRNGVARPERRRKRQA